MSKANYLLLKAVKCILRIFNFALWCGFCNNCRKLTIFIIRGENLREDVSCVWCHSFNRQRQIRRVLDREIKQFSQKNNEFRIWNTENSLSLHNMLSEIYSDKYVSSEYIDPTFVSGDYVDGVRHEDICNTSFPSEYFDIVISSDILEHVPDPQKALHEISRILKQGGEHIFTVPFIEGMSQNECRAKIDKEGTIEYIKPPEFHGDPLRKEGILVYTIFGEELGIMCEKEGLGFKKIKFKNYFFGIIGSALVFVSKKHLTNNEGQIELDLITSNSCSIQ